MLYADSYSRTLLLFTLCSFLNFKFKLKKICWKRFCFYLTRYEVLSVIHGELGMWEKLLYRWPHNTWRHNLLRAWVYHWVCHCTYPHSVCSDYINILTLKWIFLKHFSDINPSLPFSLSLCSLFFAHLRRKLFKLNFKQLKAMKYNFFA